MKARDTGTPARRIWPTALVLMGVYALMLMPLMVWPEYLDTPLGLIAVLPMLVVYALDSMGVPGLFSANCSWGWCDPALAGWLVMLVSAIIMIWLIAVALVAWRRRKGRESGLPPS